MLATDRVGADRRPKYGSIRGGWRSEITALSVLYHAQPDLDDYEAKATLSAMLCVEPYRGEPRWALAPRDSLN